MSRFAFIDVRKTAVATALVITMVPGMMHPDGAAAAPAATGSIEFDEIDHAYTIDKVPPPGPFNRDVGQVARSASPAEVPKNIERWRHDGGKGKCDRQ